MSDSNFGTDTSSAIVDHGAMLHSQQPQATRMANQARISIAPFLASRSLSVQRMARRGLFEPPRDLAPHFEFQLDALEQCRAAQSSGILRLNLGSDSRCVCRASSPKTIGDNSQASDSHRRSRGGFCRTFPDQRPTRYRPWECFIKKRHWAHWSSGVRTQSDSEADSDS